jgi:thioredoxin reductase
MPALTASAILQQRVLSNEKLEIRCGMKVEAVVGDTQVESIEFVEAATGRRGIEKVDGVFVFVWDRSTWNNQNELGFGIWDSVKKEPKQSFWAVYRFFKRD